MTASASSTRASAFGTTLVTGGCGFIGSSLVRSLQSGPGCGPIHVVSRNPTTNLIPGVTYTACDLRDSTSLSAFFSRIRPQTVFHVASPASYSLQAISPAEYITSNVEGTQNLIAACQGTDSVRALVYTSSATVAAGCPHVNLSESAPYNSGLGGRCTPYEWSKTLGEQAILQANGSGTGDSRLKTTALRVFTVYGEGDVQFAPNMVDAVQAGNTRVQIGDNSNLIDQTWIGNAVQAHILAARALLDPTQAYDKVDGEAFNITDGNPIRFWDYTRMYYRAAGDKTELKDVTVIPGWVALRLAQTAEWVWWAWSFGTRKPEQFNEQLVLYCLNTFSYDITKARRTFGYDPKSHLDEEVPKSVQYVLAQRGIKPPS